MRMHRALVALVVVACGDPTPAAPTDAAVPPVDGTSTIFYADMSGVVAAPDSGPAACEWAGAPGVCVSVASCNAIADHTPESSGSCTDGNPCCIDTPDVADNPPVPSGWVLMQQSMVTQAMTDWAVMILHDPITYPMYSTTMMTFGAQPVMARVEWHPPDFQNSVVHRGVTLYVPQ